ncbi:hypothetical protein HMPREF9629_00925 [Peptoanaerobacter stomatis]|uniref:Uncharacterized protein n=1 Tax=Peptoanaerobacter stomatis TaxID=796937 RepID=G9X3G8_9FIRM|nr:extracellular solute-binding protein [Peptoanaerobacter stomatis]EHL09933.1 hypothetical protein HMPREF9629_00925 [Peptoanaerobacter stomatis]
MKKIYVKIVVVMVSLILLLSSCISKRQTKLDPKNPILLKLVTYYSDKQLEKLKEMTDEFNETEGLKKGIIVEVIGMNTISKTNENILKAAYNIAGSEEFPDMFIAYKSIVPYLKEKKGLVDYRDYFTDEELSKYLPNLIELGKMEEDEKILMLPLGSFVNMMFVNDTEFKLLRYKIGVDYSSIKTYEGLVESAEKYYNYTDSLTQTENDGKPLYSTDTVAEQVLSVCREMNEDLIINENGKTKINFDYKVARKLWDLFYVPIIKGYFIRSGRYASEDMRTGKTLLALSTTIGAAYMPDKIMETNGYIRSIDMKVVNSPYLENHNRVSIIQGGGIFTTKSMKLREFASIEFIKWLTSKENNLKFAVESGYIPVKIDNSDADSIRNEAKSRYIDDLIREAVVMSKSQIQEDEEYVLPDVDGYEEIRIAIERAFLDDIKNNRKKLLERVKNGENYDEVLAEYLSEKSFYEWKNKVAYRLEKGI